MASVIRNPIILHCLDQFGITPAEARAAEAGAVPDGDALGAEYAAFIAALPQLTLRQTPRADEGK